MASIFPCTKEALRNSKSEKVFHKPKRSQIPISIQPIVETQPKSPKLSKTKLRKKSKNSTSPLHQNDSGSKLSDFEISKVKLQNPLTKNIHKFRNLSGELCSQSEKKLIEKFIQIEKCEGKEITNSKIRGYLDIFDDVSEVVPSLKLTMNNLKSFFQSLYYLKLSQDTEISELTQKKEFNIFESFEIDTTLPKFEESESNFINNLINENKTLSETNLALKKEVVTLTNKEKQYKNFILFLKSNSENFEESFKSYISKKKPKPKLVPKLSLKLNDAKLNSRQVSEGFHEEFMSKIDEFSESWRKQIDFHKKG